MIRRAVACIFVRKIGYPVELWLILDLRNQIGTIVRVNATKVTSIYHLPFVLFLLTIVEDASSRLLVENSQEQSRHKCTRIKIPVKV